MSLAAAKRLGRSWSTLPHAAQEFRDLLALPADPLGDARGPQIELLVVVASKDFGTLPDCLAAAIGRQANPVSSVTLITPGVDVPEALSIASSASSGLPYQVLCEDDLLSADVRGDLRRAFPARYGWILQQLLTTHYVATSHQSAILVIDADTVMVSPRALVTDSGLQILTPTFEFNAPYYEFLAELGLCSAHPRFTFVPHWMLMQPEFMRRALSSVEITTVDQLAYAVIDRSSRDTPSNVCVEYELYAQYLLTQHPDKVLLAKWGNVAVPDAPEKSSLRTLLAEYRDFGSISLHSYLRQ